MSLLNQCPPCKHKRSELKIIVRVRGKPPKVNPSCGITDARLTILIQ